MRYQIFGGERYYPQGGMKDWLISFDTLVGAKRHARQLQETNEIYWYHIFDVKKRLIVAESWGK